MKVKLIISFIWFFILFNTHSVYGESEFGMGFGIKHLYYDYEKLNKLVYQDDLPKLKGPLWLHGGEFYGHRKNWVTIGFSAYGALQEEQNDHGYTNYEGAMAGFFVEGSNRFKSDLYGRASFTLSCGRFNFASMYDNGNGVNGYANAMFAEPSLGLGYKILNRLDIILFWSSIYSINEHVTWVGSTQEKDVLVGLEGNIIGLMVRSELSGRSKTSWFR